MQTPEGSQLNPAAYESGSILSLIRSLYSSEPLQARAPLLEVPAPAAVVSATAASASSCLDPVHDSRQLGQAISNSLSSSSSQPCSQKSEVPDASPSSHDVPLSGVVACSQGDNNTEDAGYITMIHQEELLGGGDAVLPEISSRDGGPFSLSGSIGGDGFSRGLDADPLPYSTATQTPAAESHAHGTSGSTDKVEESAGQQKEQQQQEEEEEAQAELSMQQEQSIARLQLVEERLAERSQLQEELSQYVQAVKDRVDEAGDKLVELPSGYMVMVEQMLQEARAQSEALLGWDGPRRQVFP